MHPGIVWITGITASGKSTLAKRLQQGLLNSRYENVELLDGDDLRKRLNFKYGHSNKDRMAVMEISVNICKETNKLGNLAILSSIGHKKAMRDYARSQTSAFMEVYLDCPVDVCAKRDYKGLYEKARAGEYQTFVGVTEPYERSEFPDLVLNTAENSIDECSKILFKSIVECF